VVQASIAELKSSSSSSSEGAEKAALSASNQLYQFKNQAIDLIRREEAYPQRASPDRDVKSEGADGAQVVLSLVGYAPQERRLFSSLPASDAAELAEIPLPLGVSTTRVYPSSATDRVQSLGELFAPPRSLPPLQPPKQPKSQAKGNTLDFYYPELTAKSPYRSNSYFSAKLSAGHYLDYSNATPSSTTKTRQHERAQSLAGKKPSTTELELSEMESLFRGAFSSFAPCKDDSAAVVPSNVAGRMWWQRCGRRAFQNMIEVEYYDDVSNDADAKEAVVVDETAIQDAIDNWDSSNVDPSLEEVMGSNRDEHEKEAEEILDEVTDLIETLSSYQRIRNLTLPNSQNRQSSDPVNGDMLANAGPQPSEDEQATYQVLKAQLALIIKTLPPFAVAKLNGDQLDDLLISTKIQVGTDQYRGVMEEDDAGVQARIRSQQQQQQQQLQQQQQVQSPVSTRPAAQRTPSISHQPFSPGNQYGTPTRTPSHNQQFFRPGATPSFQANYQPPRTMGTVGPQSAPQRLAQPNQYNRPNGFSGQYATQLAKAQTPYGHQNMPQYATQPRPQYSQMPAQGTPNARYNYNQGFQQASSPSPTGFTNGSAIPQQRTMSPQMSHMQAYSPSPNMQQQPPPPRYGTPNQGMGGQLPRPPSNPSQNQMNQRSTLTGYHTVIPEAQQQRILEQAKARVAAHERTAMFADKIAQPGVSGLAGIGLGGSVDANRLAAARANMGNQQKPQTPVGQRQGMNGSPIQHVPLKVTPVPVPPIPGLPQQQKPSTPSG
jgi:hypothetical protein